MLYSLRISVKAHVHQNFVLDRLYADLTSKLLLHMERLTSHLAVCSLHLHWANSDF